ncbi:MAG: bacteriophage holin [Candidatus Aceula lacicola]|nr:bacteriophage holin [Candidatus Aceula lacicola]
MNKLDAKALGLSCGILWGGAMLFLGIFDIFSTWGIGITNLMSTLYIGYQPTILGSIIGAVWGFFDAGVGGFIIALLYNKLAK